ncbi:MAG: Sec-independent protein translocase protein TatB [Acidobacteriota bacterium]
MFGPLGGFEILVLAAIGLLVFGPRRLPEIGRTLGKAMLEFRKAASDLRNSIEREIDLDELKKTTHTIHQEVREQAKALDPMGPADLGKAVGEKKEDEGTGGGGKRD